MSGSSDLPIDHDAASDEVAAEIHLLAERVFGTLADLGLPVRLLEQRMTFNGGDLPQVTVTELGTRNRAANDADDKPRFAHVTVVVERHRTSAPFSGICVEWAVAENVGAAAASALQELMDHGDGLPDPLPAAMARNGRMHEIMRDAIRSALEYDGFRLREDADHRPYGLWLVTRTDAAPDGIGDSSEAQAEPRPDHQPDAGTRADPPGFMSKSDTGGSG